MVSKSPHYTVKKSQLNHPKGASSASFGKNGTGVTVTPIYSDQHSWNHKINLSESDVSLLGDPLILDLATESGKTHLKQKSYANFPPKQKPGVEGTSSTASISCIHSCTCS